MLFHLFDSIAQDTYEKGIPKLVIHLFGCTAEGQAVHLTVNGFEPFFYVRLPEVPGKTETGILTDFKQMVGKALIQAKVNPDLVEITRCRKKLMYGYTGEKDFPFAEIRMKSKKVMYAARKLFLDDRTRPIFQLYKGSDVLKVYDATLDPMLRFFHIQNLQPCGWVEADVSVDTDGNGECEWDDIKPFKGIPPSPTAPLLMNFWDIECYSESGEFPIAENNDPVIQIGNVLVRGTTIEKHIFVLGTCDPVEGAIVHTYKTEKNMLLAWANFMSERNPDVYVGYNIFGFDEKYLWERAEILGITEYDCFQAMNRLRATDETGKENTKLETKFLSSSALGDNYLYMWTTKGRLQIDLYHYVRRLTALPSYKLDAVCQNFMSGKCSAVDTSKEGEWKIKTKGTSDVRVGRYLTLLDDTGEAIVEKLRVIAVEDGKSITVESSDEEYEDDAVKWAIVKDDVSPAEIFEFHKEGGSSGRAKVAAYCIQDCDLVYELYKKLDVFNNAMSMANVCSVPVNYIFTRGQGIKIESLIFKECYELGMVVEVLDSPSRDPNVEDDEVDSYEGAIVLDPVPGFYSESPIGVCDFASLYPSSIISENISHDSLVWVKDFPLNGGKPVISWGNEADEKNAPPGTRWTNIEFDILRPDPQDTRVNPTKIKMGVRVCRYAQKPDGSKHTLPNIVAKLLAARKSKRKEAEKENDPFRKALLDAEQLAYKLTANSLYGQLGSSTFKIRLQNLAASVTSYGRKQILFAKEAIEQFYGPAAKVIYGDTDSLFVDFGMTGPDAIQKTMDITEEAGKFVSSCLKSPHDFEYDKVFDRFIIFSKKRYVGNKYEDSATDFKQTSMGIVLKRRDNAPVLKTIYGGALKILLNEKDVPKAVDFVRAKTLEMVEGKMSMSQLTITKSLSANYKSATPPAHKILADRIKERDPGNAPTAGERMGFIYVAAKAGELAAKLQGDRIETPDFIRKNGLRPDYEYYIERQLMKPIGQLFGIMVEKIPGFQMPVKGLDESKRDSIAIELLFRKALDACSKAAKREFMTKQFGITLPPVASSNILITPSSVVGIQQIQSKKTQPKIDTYFLHKKIAQEYKEIKKTKATALKEQLKESNGTTKKGGSD